MTARRERHWGRPGWWVFDSPLLRDPLWWSCIAAAVLAGGWGAWRETAAGLVEAVPMGAFIGVGLQTWLVAAVVLGSVRAYRRARAGAA